MDDDLELLKQAERALSEIDRTDGLIERHADVLARLRIRIHGGPQKSLEDLMQVTGEMQGKGLHDRLAEAEARKAGDLSDLMASEPKKKPSLDDLL